MRPGRLGVGVIGAGRVGAVLGAALRAVGHSVVGVSAISEQSRDRAAALLPGVPLLEPAEIVERCELVVLAVPDDDLVPLVRGLAELDHWQTGQIVLHTSGRHGIAALAPAAARGAVCLAVHPVLAFTGMSLDLARLTGAMVAVTAPAAFLPIAQALVVEMGAEPVVLSEEDFPVVGGILARVREDVDRSTRQALRRLAEADVEDPARMAGPLVRAVLENALAAGPERPATGLAPPDSPIE
ncbi:hypothetical protein GCM10011512_20840 [Tersicoccus solisilvae]|uniref:Oxidoreductase n=1 Tax=Tersicoccus solisilvae TaxID=1882339 RepID=A0ABQ1PB15_9MICC|nr:hypothetical protein GCM10011512_20840 [Tersicoccus solisilvae]